MDDDSSRIDPRTEAEAFEAGLAAFGGSRGTAGARRDARRALRVLLGSPTDPADSPIRDRRPLEVPCTFEHMALCSDGFIVTIDRAETGGLEHRLFMAATEGLSDEEYLACIDVSSAPLGAAELI